LTFALTAALAATQGGRKYQEDTGVLWPGDAAWPGVADVLPLADGQLLAVLGDGMGGHVGGALASTLACTQFLTRFCAHTAGQDRGLMARMVETLEAANAALDAKVKAQPMYSGMGTTLIGAYVAPFELGSGLSWISVGDSLLYLWRRGDLARLNEDHSLAPELDKMAEAGKISWAEAQADPRRHFLRSALTGGEIEMIDVTPRPLPLAEGDIVIVASDGIHTLDEADIARIISDAQPLGARQVAKALVRGVEAIGHPHQDNTTVIAIAVGADR
jgi:PPM family protein phosphatase